MTGGVASISSVGSSMLVPMNEATNQLIAPGRMGASTRMCSHVADSRPLSRDEGAMAKNSSFRAWPMLRILGIGRMRLARKAPTEQETPAITPVPME